MNVFEQTQIQSASVRRLPMFPLYVMIGLFLGATSSVLRADDVTMTASDSSGSSSFSGGATYRWPGGLPPAAGSNYFTGTFLLRSPATDGSYTFAGDSLTVGATNGSAAGRFLLKSYSTLSASFILNGGMTDLAPNGGGGTNVLAGTVNVIGASFLGSTVGRILDVAAPISGSANLQIGLAANTPFGGTTVTANGGSGLVGSVRLSAANPYSGTLSSAGDNSTFASHGKVELGNVNAVQNATLSLNTGASAISALTFVDTANTGAFNIGGLASGPNNPAITLNDTAGAAVALSVGANNANTVYGGPISGDGSLTKVGTGTLILSGANTYNGFTMINNGALQLGSNGLSGALSVSSTITDNGNLTINRNNAVVQGVDFSASPITGTGSFTQSGSGTTTLNAANSYSGATTVNAGKLVISTAQIGTGAITVADGAKLGITVSGSSQLSPSTLALGTSGATTLEFGGVNSTTIAPINAGTVSAGGQVTVNINTGTFAAGNSYPLLHWNTSGPANAGSFTLGVSPGLSATFSVSGSTLYMNVSAVSDIWNGGINGNWDTTTANWTGHASVFANGDAVLFDDSAANPGVTVSALVQPGTILFNNASAFYNVTSSGGNNIGGTTGLTKNSAGTVALAGGANTYTGPTVVNAGILMVGALADGGLASDIGAASSASANLVLNGGTLQYTGGDTATSRGATLGANNGTLEVTSGGVTLTENGVIVGPGSLTKTGDGILALSGANTFSGGLTLNAGQLNINNSAAIGTGTLTIAANTILDNSSGSDVVLSPAVSQVWATDFTYAGIANSLNLGTGPVSLGIGTRTVTVNGNTLTVGGVLSGTAGLTKQGGGTLVLSGANTFSGQMNVASGTLAVGNDQAAGVGQLQLNSGTIIQSADSTSHTLTNALNFNGANANMTFGGTGNLIFTGNNLANGSDKTFTVNNQTEFSGALGGTTRTIAGTGKMIISGINTYSGTTTISFGSTLQIGNGGTTGSSVGGGGIDDEGVLIFNRSNNIVQGVDLSAAPITGAGSIVQAGAGTTTLNGANTYSGTVTVTNGELFITPNYQAGGAVVVADGAKFGVSANSVSNSATIGSLTLGTGGATTLDFSYTVAGDPTNAALQASSVTVNGTSAIRVGGSFAVGVFPIMKYGSLFGSFASTVAAPRGVTATLSNDVAGQTLYVRVTSVSSSGIVWTGTNSVSPNLWDLNATTNWLIGGVPTDYIEVTPPGDAVVFNDLGSGTVLLSNTVSPTSVTISNVSVDYAFQGSGQINSAQGLTKLGSGNLTLNVPGNYGGGTVISNGTLNIGGVNQAFVNLSGNSLLTNTSGAAVLTINNSTNTTYSGTIVGAFGLTKIGNGTLTLTSTNSLSGNVFVRSGSLILDSGSISSQNFSDVGQLDSDNATLTLKGSAAFTNNSDFNVGDLDNSVGTLNISDNASLTMNAFYIGSANAANSTASGTVNQSGGTVTEISNGTGTFAVGGRTSVSGTGVYNMSGGTLTANAGIRVGGTGIGTFNQSGGTVFARGGVNIARIAGSSGTYNLNGGTLSTFNVTSSTSANAIFNFNGGVLQALTPANPWITSLTAANVNTNSIIDTDTNNPSIAQQLLDGGNGAGLAKVGSGTLYLDGFNTYTGTTVVSNGVLAGVGSLTGPVLVTSTGRIGAGDAGTTVGTLTINNNLTIQSGAMLRITKTGGTTLSDLVAVTGTVNYGGILIVSNITSDATPLAVGDSFTLFSANTHNGSFSSIAGSPGPGLAYNFSNGVLSVVVGGKSVPQFTGVSISGTTLTLSATNGTRNGQFVLLGSTNVALPLGQWTPILTNSFDASGNFNFSTNIVDLAVPREFYIISQ